MVLHFGDPALSTVFPYRFSPGLAMGKDACLPSLGSFLYLWLRKQRSLQVSRMVFRASLGFLEICSIYRKRPVLEIREDSPQRWEFLR